MPKSLDVSKAIDRARDDRASVLAVTSRLAELAQGAGITRGDVDELMGTSDMGGWWLSRLQHRCACPSVENWSTLRRIIPGATELDAEVWRLNGRKGTPGEAWESADLLAIDERWNEPSGVVNVGQGSRTPVARQIKAPNSPEAARWQGWGTALKPGWEIIVVARKPLIGTVAANILQYGTGALNIDGCRIGSEARTNSGMSSLGVMHDDDWSPRPISTDVVGRWPANVVLDSDAAAELDQQSGELTSGTLDRSRITAENGIHGAAPTTHVGTYTSNSGGASRFYFTAKASTDERIHHNGTSHPTVKPLSLMRWLAKLVTRPGGVVLDPFAGSGTTVEACILEGFQCIAIEREAPYLPLITQRINRRLDPVAYLEASGDDLGLFGDIA